MRLDSCLANLAPSLIYFLITATTSAAVEVVHISESSNTIDITRATNVYVTPASDTSFPLRLVSAIGSDGIVYQIEIFNNSQMLATFALKNESNSEVHKILATQNPSTFKYPFPWLNREESKVNSILGFRGSPPVRNTSHFGDVFSITIAPGETITYIASLTSSIPSLSLWDPQVYREWEAKRKIYNIFSLIWINSVAIFLFILSIRRKAKRYSLYAGLILTFLIFSLVEGRYLGLSLERIVDTKSEQYGSSINTLFSESSSPISIKAIPLNVTIIPQQ